MRKCAAFGGDKEGAKKDPSAFFYKRSDAGVCHQRTTSSAAFYKCAYVRRKTFFLLRLVPATRLHNLSEWTFHSSKMDEFLEKCWRRAGKNTTTVSLVRAPQEKDQSRECAKYIILTCESFAIRL